MKPPLYILIALFISFSSVVVAEEVKRESDTFKSEREKKFTLEAAELDAEQKYDEAIAAYSKAIKLNSEGSPAYRGRALAYAKKGNYRAAIADFSKAIEIDPTDVDAYNGQALSYTYLKEYSFALEGFQTVLELAPARADTYNDIGLIYQLQGENDQALRNFSRAIELDPGKQEKAYISRAIIYNDTEKVDEAIADLDKAAGINPKNYRVFYNRAISYFYKQDYDKSWQDLHTVDALGATVPPLLRQELIKASGRDR